MFSRFCISSFKSQALLALICALIIITWQARSYTPNPLGADSSGYLSVALDLVETGVYGDGWYANQAAVKGAAGQGMFFAPALSCNARRGDGG